ncbi:MAG TPA: DMT family transporter [Kofleriaceae bacterium]|nr:DMT family transporter [Kofleriaceae bacterium]
MAGFVLLLAVLAVSTSAPLVRAAAPAPALEFAALRVCIAAFILTAIAGRGMRALRGLDARERGFVVLAGLLLGAHFGVWITSLYFTSTAASVALVATQPLFAALLGHVLLGEGASRRELAGIGIAAIGCASLAGSDWSASSDAVIGDGLAVVGAITAAGYLLIGRRLRATLPLAPYLAAVNLVAGAALLVAALVAAISIGAQGPHAYQAIAACAVLGSVLGHSLLNWSVRRLRAHLVTLAILGEPIAASLLTWSFFDERPPAHAVVGGAIILFGIAVAFVRIDRMRARPAAASPP